MISRMLLAACFAASFGVLSHFSSAAAANASPTPVNAIDPTQFGGPIDNAYFPLVPGTRLIYEGTSGDTKLRDEFTVTHETKQIVGVTCVVVHDVVYEDGELAEDTLDWFAQDKD